MNPAELHDAVRNGLNAGDVDALVGLYEPDAVLLDRDGTPAVGHDMIRATWEAAVAFGGTVVLETRFAVECGEIALMSNQFTFSVAGYSESWITAEVARRQPDGSWKYVIDNPCAAPVAPA